MDSARDKGQLTYRAWKECAFIMAVTALLLCMVPAAMAQEGRVRVPDDHAFVHPGILHNKGELDFVKDKIQAGEEPWQSAWETMRSHDVAQLDWEPDPYQEVARGAYNNPDIGSTELMRDGQAAYAHALQWYITEDEAHAEKCVEILNAWPPVLETITEHDARLLVGMVGINYANAAELMRHTYDGWAQEDQERFEEMLRGVFYPLIEDFYPSANGNWDAAMIQTMMAMGVFLDDPGMFNRGVDYFLYGRGNGAITNYINEQGIVQESGRDQAHTQMGLGYLGCAAEIGWKQRLDLYGAFDNRLAAGYEYTAKYNLGHDVPYEPFTSIEQRYHYPRISDQGRGNFSPIHERVYNHYHNRAGLDMPYTAQVIERQRPEGQSNAYVSWGTLFAELPAFEKGEEPDAFE